MILDRNHFDRYERMFLHCDKEQIRESAKWVGDKRLIYAALPGRAAFFVDRSNEHDNRYQLAKYEHDGEQWRTATIVLPSELQNVIPSPNGSVVLIACANQWFLWDTEKNRQIGKSLSLAADSDWPRRKLSGTGDAIWDPSGMSFCYWQFGAIHQFDGATGDFLRTLGSHRRRGDLENGDHIEIVAATISPNANWLATADDSGRIVKTRITETRTTLEQLRRDTQRPGGKIVTPNGDVKTWRPASIAE